MCQLAAMYTSQRRPLWCIIRPIMNRTPYSTDINDAEWQLLEPLLLPPKPGGRLIKYPRREIVNTMPYILHTGIARRV